MPHHPRLGFHYFPDTQHYRQADLEIWLPRLREQGAAWLTLLAPATWAIPENFLRGLQNAGIEPVVHFPLTLKNPPTHHDLHLLFASYARWGVRYLALFDRPNLRTQWPPNGWAQNNLVENFLDVYLPLAETVCRAQMIPLFPPLEPGGDYWDTSFLRAALAGLARRAQPELLERLALGAYAWAGGKPLNWGAGGPERWPGAQPYRLIPGEQDQRGFCIFDWYQAIAQAELRRPAQILLLRAGDPLQTNQRQRMARLLAGQEETLSLPPELVAGCLWLLAAPPGSSHTPQAWYQPDGSPNLPQSSQPHLAQNLHPPRQPILLNLSLPTDYEASHE